MSKWDFAPHSLSPQIRGVLLDIDNTCYEYAPCHQAALQAAIIRLTEIFGSDNDYDEHYSTAQKVVKARNPDQASSHSRLLYFLEMLSDLHDPQKFLHAVELEDIYWNTFLSEIKPVAGLHEFLRSVKNKSVRIVCLTDLTTRIQCKKIDALGIDDYIDDLVTSEMVGVEKPNPRLFALGLTKLGTAPSETLMVGDDLNRDIDGAKAVGIHTLHVRHE